MTWDGHDATYSPIPTGPAPDGTARPPWTPPSGPVHPSVEWPVPGEPLRPPQGAYVEAPGTARTGPDRKGGPRLGLIVLAGLLALALVVAGVSVVVARQTSETKELIDAQSRVTVRVPRAWSDYTEPDLVRDPTRDRSAPQNDAWSTPVIDAESPLGGQIVVVYVEPVATRPLPEAHAAGVAEVCHDGDCASRGQPEATTIDGRPALQQLVTFADDAGAAVIATVQSPAWTVQVVADRGASITGASDPAPLIERVHAVTLLR